AATPRSRSSSVCSSYDGAATSDETQPAVERFLFAWGAGGWPAAHAQTIATQAARTHAGYRDHRAILALTVRRPARLCIVDVSAVGTFAKVTRVDDLASVVTRARTGDRKAFAELYRRFNRAVHGVVLAKAPYRDADDLVQDAFATALERLPQLAEPA